MGADGPHSSNSPVFVRLLSRDARYAASNSPVFVGLLAMRALRLSAMGATPSASLRRQGGTAAHVAAAHHEWSDMSLVDPMP